MRGFKRVITICLIIAMALSSLFACGTPETEPPVSSGGSGSSGSSGGGHSGGNRWDEIFGPSSGDDSREDLDDIYGDSSDSDHDPDPEPTPTPTPTPTPDPTPDPEPEPEPEPEPVIPEWDNPNQIDATPFSYLDYGKMTFDEYETSLFYRNDYDINLGDPTVLHQVENGESWYYVSGTTTGKNYSIYKTKNFTDWTSLGVVYTPPTGLFGTRDFWAPQLFYDKDASWSYYLGSEAGEGKGLYCIFFSARYPNKSHCASAVAFSKTVEGPYTHFVGKNANNDDITLANPLFEIEKLKDLNLYASHPYGNLYSTTRSFIDTCPYIDPVTGDKYLYFVRNRAGGDSSNDVWGVKMKDWVSPDYATTAPLSAYGYTTIEKTTKYNFTTTNKIDEGPFMYYKDFTDDGVDNGKYYLTLSMGDTNDKLYPVIQAVGDTPLGPFTKLQPEDNGMVICPEDLVDIHGSGHHCFFEANGQLFVASHTYIIKSGASIGPRYFTFAEVKWTKNGKGQDVMRANGPHKTIQPLPSISSGYTAISEKATVKVDNTAVTTLNDGLIKLNSSDLAKEEEFTKETTVTMEWNKYITARALLVYNTYDYAKAFSKVDRIELSFRRESEGKVYTGTTFIKDLTFDFNQGLVPETYLTAKGSSSKKVMRPMSAAIAEFNEVEINKITFVLKPGAGQASIALSEIVVLGKESTTVDGTLASGGEIEYLFPEYKKDKVDELTYDGVLNESVWKNAKKTFTLNGVTADAQYGERKAKVYATVDEKRIYFAFEVTDKNLYFNANSSQGQNSGVEIYFAKKGTTTFAPGCYSVRVNPTGYSGFSAFNLGFYEPTSGCTEWQLNSALNSKVRIGVFVDGKVVNDPTDTQSSDTKGYIIEISIDKSLIGIDETDLAFTTAFVQDTGYSTTRLGNTFISGTNYIKPDTWINLE